MESADDSRERAIGRLNGTEGSVGALLDEKEEDHAKNGPEASRCPEIDSNVRSITKGRDDKWAVKSEWRWRKRAGIPAELLTLIDGESSVALACLLLVKLGGRLNRMKKN